MKKESLILDIIQSGEKKQVPVRVRLGTKAYPSDDRGMVYLSPECDNIQDFEKALAELKKDMDTLLLRAKDAFKEYQIQDKEGAEVLEFQKPEDIWRVLEESGSIDEMGEIFNSLNLQKRQEVANFVLTQLNIFKGVASTFSQHYNEQECILE